MSSLGRRSFLGSVGAVGTSVLTAGCSVLSGSAGIPLTGLEVRSDLSEQHTVRVELERNGTSVFEETVEVSDGTPITRDAIWSTDPASYRIRWAVFGPSTEGDIRVTELTEVPRNGDDADCYVGVITLADVTSTTNYVELYAAELLDPFTCG